MSWLTLKTEDRVHVDLIRTVGIVLVIIVHAAIEPHPIVETMDLTEVVRWFTVNTYDSLARSSVPLFVMISGALLLQPAKVEPIRVFLKKRTVRIGLPLIFWGAIYFVWRFLVNQEAFSPSIVVQGVLTGPYYHFWFLYMLFGLYLITPVLRVLTVHATRGIMRYFMVLLIFGTAVMPPRVLLSGVAFELKIFAITGWITYFLLGYYLLETRARTSILVGLWLTAVFSTNIGTYAVTSLAGGHRGLVFLDFLSVTVVLASSSLFLLLGKVSPIGLERRFPRGSKLIHFIGQSTLAIYLLHVIVLESLQKGYLGFQISVNTIHPIVEVPLITVLTLFICVGLVFLLKKVPVLKKLIG